MITTSVVMLFFSAFHIIDAVQTVDIVLVIVIVVVTFVVVVVAKRSLTLTKRYIAAKGKVDQFFPSFRLSNQGYIRQHIGSDFDEF